MLAACIASSSSIKQTGPSAKAHWIVHCGVLADWAAYPVELHMCVRVLGGDDEL